MKIWERHVVKLPTPSNLTSKTMLKILGEATGGYIGLMDKSLREAIFKSIGGVCCGCGLMVGVSGVLKLLRRCESGRNIQINGFDRSFKEIFYP